MQEDENQPKSGMQPPRENGANEVQPEPEMPEEASPIPLPRTGQQHSPPLLTQVQKQRQYFIGLVVGLIPVIVFLISFGLTVGIPGNSGASFIYGLIAAFVLYVAEFIVTIVFLVIDRRRFIGYGLLTAFLASPVLGTVGCLVLPGVLHQ